MKTKFQGINTKLIHAVISKDELKVLVKKDYVYTKDMILISIQNPDDKEDLSKYHNHFKKTLHLKFYDLVEEFGSYKTISEEQANQIKNFILENKEETFVVHCEYGQSRSSAIGLAIECIHGLNIEESVLKTHWRYDFNEFIFDKIIK